MSILHIGSILDPTALYCGKQRWHVSARLARTGGACLPHVTSSSKSLSHTIQQTSTIPRQENLSHAACASPSHSVQLTWDPKQRILIRDSRLSALRVYRRISTIFPTLSAWKRRRRYCRRCVFHFHIVQNEWVRDTCAASIDFPTPPYYINLHECISLNPIHHFHILLSSQTNMLPLDPRPTMDAPNPPPPTSPPFDSY
jgi:hypothetical protein